MSPSRSLCLIGRRNSGVALRRDVLTAVQPYIKLQKSGGNPRKTPRNTKICSFMYSTPRKHPTKPGTPQRTRISNGRKSAKKPMPPQLRPAANQKKYGFFRSARLFPWKTSPRRYGPAPRSSAKTAPRNWPQKPKPWAFAPTSMGNWRPLSTHRPPLPQLTQRIPLPLRPHAGFRSATCSATRQNSSRYTPPSSKPWIRCAWLKPCPGIWKKPVMTCKFTLKSTHRPRV